MVINDYRKQRNLKHNTDKFYAQFMGLDFCLLHNQRDFEDVIMYCRENDKPSVLQKVLESPYAQNGDNWNYQLIGRIVTYCRIKESNISLENLLKSGGVRKYKDWDEILIYKIINNSQLLGSFEALKSFLTIEGVQAFEPDEKLKERTLEVYTILSKKA